MKKFLSISLAALIIISIFVFFTEKIEALCVQSDTSNSPEIWGFCYDVITTCTYDNPCADYCNEDGNLAQYRCSGGQCGEVVINLEDPPYSNNWFCQDGKIFPEPPPFVPVNISFDNPAKADEPEDLIENVAGFIFMMALIFAGIMVVVSAYYFITSAGDAQKIETAKKIILYTLIGLIIVFFARAIVHIINQL